MTNEKARKAVQEIKAIKEVKVLKALKTMKKGCAVFALSLVLALTTVMPAMATDLQLDKNKEKIEVGLLQTNIANFKTDKKYKVSVEKGSNKYVYSIRNRSVESFPLQMGSGSYAVTFLENVGGNQYKIIGKETITMENQSSTVVYLNSIQIVDWATTMQSIAKAKELTKGLQTDNEKFDALYAYMTKNFVYDFDKISTLTSDYLPDIEKIFTVQKGICYDYSALFGAMLRSVGIPAKLCMGYTDYLTEYHAWNEVFLDGTWKIVDTTNDAVYVARNKPVDKFKAEKQMSKTKEY